MLSAPDASFRAHYQALVASGAIEPDAAQAEAAEALAELEARLANYKPVRKQGLLGRLFADRNGAPPRGSSHQASMPAENPGLARRCS